MCTHSLVGVGRNAKRCFQAGSVFIHAEREVPVALVYRGHPFLYLQCMGVALVTKPIRQLDQQLYPLFGLLSIERHLEMGQREGRWPQKCGTSGGKVDMKERERVRNQFVCLTDTIACSLTQ